MTAKGPMFREGGRYLSLAVAMEPPETGPKMGRPVRRQVRAVERIKGGGMERIAAAVIEGTVAGCAGDLIWHQAGLQARLKGIPDLSLIHI